MMFDPMTVEFIGFAAGGMIALSALPRIVDLWRNPSKAIHESTIRNLALFLGNLGWVIVGLSKESLCITVMCVVAALLNGSVLALTLRAKAAAKAGRAGNIERKNAVIVSATKA